MFTRIPFSGCKLGRKAFEPVTRLLYNSNQITPLQGALHLHRVLNPYVRTCTCTCAKNWHVFIGLSTHERTRRALFWGVWLEQVVSLCRQRLVNITGLSHPVTGVSMAPLRSLWRHRSDSLRFSLPSSPTAPPTPGSGNVSQSRAGHTHTHTHCRLTHKLSLRANFAIQHPCCVSTEYMSGQCEYQMLPLSWVTSTPRILLTGKISVFPFRAQCAVCRLWFEGIHSECFETNRDFILPQHEESDGLNAL